jgi:hypothetical protein
MNKREAINYVKREFGFDVTSEWLAIVRLRHKSVLLPELGVDGSIRDESEWAILDMAGKIDTGEYGDVYYF